MAQCIGTVRSTGERCRKQAMAGQRICRSHGGGAPQNMAAAARRQQEAEATALLADRKIWNENAAPTTDPVAELLALSGRLRDAVATLGARLENTTPCVCCGTSGEMDGVRVLAFNKTIAASEKVLTNLARLGLEDRRVRVAERQVDLMLAGLVAGLAAAGIDEWKNEHLLIAARAAALSKMHAMEDEATLPALTQRHQQ